MEETKTIPVIIVKEDCENPEGTTVWGIEDIKAFGQYLINNIEPGTEIKVTFKNFTQDEWDESIAMGKEFNGEPLTEREQQLLDKIYNASV